MVASVYSPRLSAWHGDVGAIYSYSGVELHPEPGSVELTEIALNRSRAFLQQRTSESVFRRSGLHRPACRR